MLLSSMDEAELPAIPTEYVSWEQLMAECEVVGDMLRRARENYIMSEVLETYRAIREQGVEIIPACAAIYEIYFEQSDNGDFRGPETAGV